MSAERWAWMRAETPVLASRAYLNTGFSGPMTNAVASAMERRIRLELADGPTTRHVLDDARETRARLQAQFAQVFGADPEEVALTSSTGMGVSIVMAGLELGRGDRILTSSVEHGSGAVPLYHARELHGAEVEFVAVGANDSDGEIVERFASAIDERTRVVMLSEIAYSTGQLLPIPAIAEVAHRVGACVVIDGAQTGGHIPLDVRAMGADAYAIPVQKWFCGPRGLGALYVCPDWLPRVTPSLVDVSHAEEWDLLGAFTPKRDVAGKFQLSATPPVLAAGAEVALQQYLDSGPLAVFERVRELNRIAERRFDRIDGVTVESPRSEAARTGLFCFSAAGLDATELAPYLQAEHGVVTRAVREFNFIRLSLHVFNTEADIERAAVGVEQALREGIPAAVAS
jgi:L-cysteine/cystine lyase